MKTFHFDALLTEKGWLAPGYLTVDEGGRVKSISDKAPPAGDLQRQVGYFLPGFVNGHSHAFQFAMVGLAEHLAPEAKDDDFWTWREVMYKLALALSPEQTYAIARYLYTVMLEQGTTSVAEFHYLHHDVDGKPYGERALMAEQLLAAAHDAGIHMTMVPVFYKNGDFDVPARPTQRRFIFKDREAFLELVEDVRKLARRDYPGAVVGTGVHSLRAASQADVRALLDPTSSSGPLHIHIAEQKKEVEQCEKVWGKRPLEWLLTNLSLSHRHNLVHATHLTMEEVRGLAQSGATAVVCPSTEGNLGDGFFALEAYRADGGKWTVGTDSHVGLNFLDELKALDYSQRLRSQRRNVLCREGGQWSGEVAFWEAWQAGRRSLGLADKAWNPGELCDGVLLDAEHHALAGKPLAAVLSAAIYGGDSRLFKGVMRAGKWQVKEGRHEKHAAHRDAFVKVVKDLFR